MNETAWTPAFSAGLRPPPDLTVSQWADRYRMLPQRVSVEPGQWRTDRTPYLREIMDKLSANDPTAIVVLMKGAQIGAPLAIDTPIPTPSGWVTMGDVKAGDTVFDESGRPVTVLGCSDVFTERKCYRVLFSDHTEIVADADHKWTVRDQFPGHRGKRNGVYGRTVTITTEHMAATLLHNGKNRYSIPCAPPLLLGDEELPADPYTLGAWLGDGHHMVGTITTHEDDAPHIKAEIEAGGHTVRLSEAPSSGKALLLTIDPRGTFGNRPSFMDCVRMLGVYGDKHIPAIYLRASESQRWRLLRGLMDTDGTASSGPGSLCEFSTVSARLAANTMELVRSLGMKPTYKMGQPRGSENGGFGGKQQIYRITFAAYRLDPVFALQRKQARLKDPGRQFGRARSRRIVSVEEVQSVPVRCISVASESHLFLAGEGFVSSHNTEAGNNWLGYVIHYVPGPAMMVMPTVEMAKRSSKTRVAPMIEDSPALRQRVKTPRERDSGNTILTKEFRGGMLIMTGANSAVGLRSTPIRDLFLDEIDGYVRDVDGEGNPIDLAVKRTENFSRNRKIFMCSTPTVKGTSRIETAFEQTDKRYYNVPCPHCGDMAPIVWRRIVWPQDHPEDAKLACEACEQKIEERHKPQMLAAGQWIATATCPSDTVGYHLSALYSPLGWYSWASAVRDFLKAKREGRESLKAWTNTVLGETWEEEGWSFDDKTLYGHCMNYPAEVPVGAVLLTAGVDVQDDRLEVEVCGWGPGEESWSIDYFVLHGDPAHPGLWKQLAGKLAGTYEHESKALLRVSSVCIDSAGHYTQQVYDFVRSAANTGQRIHAIVGRAGEGRPIISAPQKRRTGKRRVPVPLFTVGVDTVKVLHYSRLAIEEAGPGYCHFPIGEPYTHDYFQQLTAEKLELRYERGQPRRIWVKVRNRNEALDARVYAIAALYLLRVNLDKLARIMAAKVKKASEETESPAPQPKRSKVQRRAAWRDSWRR